MNVICNSQAAQDALEDEIRAEIPREGVKIAAVTPASDEELAWAFLTLAAFSNMRQFRLTLMGGEAAVRPRIALLLALTHPVSKV